MINITLFLDETGTSVSRFKINEESFIVCKSMWNSCVSKKKQLFWDNRGYNLNILVRSNRFGEYCVTNLMLVDIIFKESEELEITFVSIQGEYYTFNFSYE